MSTMTLFHAPASPFVRKVRVLLHETGQQDRVALHEVQTSPVEPSPELLAGNPAGIVKMRFDAKRVEQLLDIAWWNWNQHKIRSEIPGLLSNDIDGFLRRHAPRP